MENIKIMIIGNTENKHKVNLKEVEVEQVLTFKYVHTIIEENGKLDQEIKTKAKKHRSIKNSFLSKKEKIQSAEIRFLEKI